MHVIIIGAGGTGSNVAPMIARFMPSHWKMTIIDGDKVEENNLERQAYQDFNVGEFKAESLSRKLNTATDKETYFYNKYLKEPKQIISIVKKVNDWDVMIISCVDNHPARIIVENTFKSLINVKTNLNNNRNIWYIDSANEEFNGEIVSNFIGGYFPYSDWRSSTEINKENIKLRSDIYPQIKNDKSGDKNLKSCSEEIEEGNTQQYATNYFAACLIFQQVQKMADGKKFKNHIVFDLKNLKMRGRNV